MLLEDKIILISGGTRGLGAGIARAAAAHGATGIMITGRDRASGEALAPELAGNSADIRFHAVDLADPLAAAGSVHLLLRTRRTAVSGPLRGRESGPGGPHSQCGPCSPLRPHPDQRAQY